MSADLYSELTMKTTPKRTLICHILPLVPKLQKGLLPCMLADLYSDLTNGLGMKNYPKMTPHMLQSAQWFQSYKEFFLSCQLICTLT